MNDDVVEALRPVIETFDKLSIAYYLGGSLASSAYGTARASMDADLVADIPSTSIPLLVDALKESYYIDEGAIREAVRDKRSFNLIHLATMFKVDIFVAGEKDRDVAVFERRKQDTLGSGPGMQVYFESCEDVVLSKLEWFKRSNETSERQWLDVLGMLKVQKDALDMRYLRGWANKLGLSDLLERALRER